MHNTTHVQNICIYLSIEQPTIWIEVQVLHEGFVDFEKGLRQNQLQVALLRDEVPKTTTQAQTQSEHDQQA